MHRSIRAVALGIIASSLVVLPLGSAWAHGDEEQGDLTLTIGFGDEPAYVGQPNSVQLLVRHGDEPVTDLGGGPEVEVSFGDASTTLPLEPSGTPGDYRAWFVPSEPGAYTFSFTGQIEGEDVEVSMTSGPDTFSEVIDPTEAAFPPAESGPTADDLAERIERESARTADAVEAAETAAASAEDAASSARTVALVAALLGLVALIVGVVALVTARRTA
jgi:hypothetical protein